MTRGTEDASIAAALGVKPTAVATPTVKPRTAKPAASKPKPRAARPVRVTPAADSGGGESGGDFGPQIIGVSPVTGRPVQSATASLREAATGGGGMSVGGFFQNVGNQAFSVIQESPAMLGLVAENLGMVTGLNTLLPGAPKPAEVQHKSLQAVKAVASDEARRWGPTFSALVHGHPLGAAQHLGKSFYSDALFNVMDIGGAWSAAGGLTRVGALGAARAAEAAGNTGRAAALRTAASKHVAPTPLMPNPPRLHAPAPLREPYGPANAVVRAEAYADRPTRILSKNMLTQRLIQRPLIRAREAIRPRVQGAADTYASPIGRVLHAAGQTERGAFDRAMTRNVRGDIVRSNIVEGALLHELSKGYATAVTKLKPVGGAAQLAAERMGLPRGLLSQLPHESDAVALHIRGLFDQPGVSPMAARDMAVARAERELTLAEQTGQRTENARANVARVKALPEHLIDPAHPDFPPRVRRAIDEGRKVVDKAQAIMVSEGRITPATAEAARSRFVDIMLGDTHWNPKAVPQSAATRAAESAVLRAGHEVNKLTAPTPTPEGWVRLFGSSEHPGFFTRDWKHAERKAMEGGGHRTYIDVSPAQMTKLTKRAEGAPGKESYRVPVKVAARAREVEPSLTTIRKGVPQTETQARGIAGAAERKVAATETRKATEKAHREAGKPEVKAPAIQSEKHGPRVGDIVKIDGRRRGVITQVRPDGTISARYLIRGRLSKSSYRVQPHRAAETFGRYTGDDLPATGLRTGEVASPTPPRPTFPEPAKNGGARWEVVGSDGSVQKLAAGDKQAAHQRADELARANEGTSYVARKVTAKGEQDSRAQGLQVRFVNGERQVGARPTDAPPTTPPPPARVRPPDVVHAKLADTVGVRPAGSTASKNVLRKGQKPPWVKFPGARKSMVGDKAYGGFQSIGGREGEAVSARDLMTGRTTAKGRETIPSAPALKAVKAAEEAAPAHGLHPLPEPLASKVPEAPTLHDVGSAYAREQHQKEVLARAKEAPRQTAVLAAQKNLSKARRELRRVREAEGPGAFTGARPGFEAGPQARYLTDIAVDKRTTAAPQGAAVSSRVTPAPIYRTHGTLAQSMGMSLSPGLPVLQLRRAITAAGQPVRLEKFLERGGYFKLDEAGKRTAELVSGKKALSMIQADPERVALVSRSSLRKTLDHLDDLPEGRAADEALLSETFRSAANPAEARAMVADIMTSGRASDYVAVSKSAMDAWRGAAKAPGTFGKVADSALSLWKTGILAFTPRWYVNNTIGNTLQFGLFAGPDLRTLWQAFGKGKAAPYRAKGVLDPEVLATQARELGGERVVGTDAGFIARVRSAGEFGFAFNNELETFWRSATNIRAAKNLLRDQGELRGRLFAPYRLKDPETGQWRRASAIDMAERIQHMPESMKAEALRITDRYLGNYRRFSPVERNVIKRIVPFYSWARFINTLVFGLPFNSPLRTLGMRTASQIGLVENPEDKSLPWYQRGDIKFGSKLRVGTSSLIPFRSTEGVVRAVAGLGGKPQDAIGGVLDVVAQSGNPALQAGLGYATGINQFTQRPFTFPVGYGGSVTSRSGSTTKWDPVTGTMQPYQPTPGLFDVALNAIGGSYTSAARQLLSGGRTTWDTTSIKDLVGYRLGSGKPASQLFRPPSQTNLPTTTKLPYGLGGVASILGAKLTLGDPNIARNAQINSAIQQYYSAQNLITTLKAQGKAQQRVP